jgi:ABC-type nitrate/sulfonate/bicarbonate transport system substrate-binding protein
LTARSISEAEFRMLSIRTFAAAVIGALIAVLLIAALAMTPGAAAQETVKLRFTLDWKLQDIHAWYFWAQEKGYFSAEKLDLTIDQDGMSNIN